MRDIKFRGKRVDNGEWVYGCLIWRKITDVVTNYSILFNSLIYPITKETISQFTGLQDKNGKDIYEGDVLETEYFNYKVIWNNARYECVETTKNKRTLFCTQYMPSSSECEVIGNIHDNPELITTENYNG